MAQVYDKERAEVVRRYKHSDTLFKVFLSALFLFLIGLIIVLIVMVFRVDHHVTKVLDNNTDRTSSLLNRVDEDNQKLVDFVQCLVSQYTSSQAEHDDAIRICKNKIYPKKLDPTDSVLNKSKSSFLVPDSVDGENRNKQSITPLTFVNKHVSKPSTVSGSRA